MTIITISSVIIEIDDEGVLVIVQILFNQLNQIGVVKCTGSYFTRND